MIYTEFPPEIHFFCLFSERVARTDSGGNLTLTLQTTEKAKSDLICDPRAFKTAVDRVCLFFSCHTCSYFSYIKVFMLF